MSDLGFTGTPREVAMKEQAYKATRTRATIDVLIELPVGDMPAGITYDSLLEARIAHYRDGGNLAAASALRAFWDRNQLPADLVDRIRELLQELFDDDMSSHGIAMRIVELVNNSR